MTSLIKINLSEKEIKIIKLISKEYTNREIATMLEVYYCAFSQMFFKFLCIFKLSFTWKVFPPII